MARDWDKPNVGRAPWTEGDEEWLIALWNTHWHPPKLFRDLRGALRDTYATVATLMNRSPRAVKARVAKIRKRYGRRGLPPPL